MTQDRAAEIAELIAELRREGSGLGIYAGDQTDDLLRRAADAITTAHEEGKRKGRLDGMKEAELTAARAAIDKAREVVDWYAFDWHPYDEGKRARGVLPLLEQALADLSATSTAAR